MTKKDYILIAGVLETYNHVSEIGSVGKPKTRVYKPAIKKVMSHIAYNLAEAFQKENSRFDFHRFYRACGLKK